MRKLFGTDGIRGIAGDVLTGELAFSVAKSAGQVLGERGGRVLIGTDTRGSAQMLETALASGFMTMGMDVTLVGVIPTPGVAYLTRKHQYTCGVVISASHNPYEYNGIKFFSKEGYKLPDEVEEEMEAYILGEKEVDPVEDFGHYDMNPDLAKEYTHYLQSLCPHHLEGMKIALDCGNGALSKIAPYVFTSLGANVFALNTNPDGKNINADCGSTNPTIIQNLVLSTGAQVGFSFDGDADRIIAVDEKGRQVDGDHILAICASYLKEKNQLPGGVVATIMSNLGLRKYLESIGVHFVESKVGDRYVLEEMLKNNYVLGGEQSGHIIFTDYNTTGDGLATGLHLVEVLLETGRTLSSLSDQMVTYPQVLQNAQVAEEKKRTYQENEIIMKAIEAINKKYQGNGRVVIRPSGTEPLVRVMLEGTDVVEMEEDVRVLVRVIEEQIGGNLWNIKLLGTQA